MASPTGPDSVVTETPIVNNNWTAITNPNMSANILMTTNVDVFVRFQLYAPPIGERGITLWNQGYISKSKIKPFGYDSLNKEPINGGIAIYVRARTAGETGTVETEWGRE